MSEAAKKIWDAAKSEAGKVLQDALHLRKDALKQDLADIEAQLAAVKGDIQDEVKADVPVVEAEVKAEETKVVKAVKDTVKKVEDEVLADVTETPQTPKKKS